MLTTQHALIFMKRIVIFASGSGTNAENIIRYFESNKAISVAMVLTNKKDAKVLDRSNKLNISSLCFNKTLYSRTSYLLNILNSINPDLIVLAGFLWKIPEYLINAFPDKIINLHPALLPKYGGKGMYGMHVHEAVLKNGEHETGITIHYVNAQYDEGAIIFQAKTSIDKGDTAITIAKKVHALEYKYFPEVIEQLLHE